MFFLRIFVQVVNPFSHTDPRSEEQDRSRRISRGDSRRRRLQEMELSISFRYLDSNTSQ